MSNSKHNAKSDFIQHTDMTGVVYVYFCYIIRKYERNVMLHIVNSSAAIFQYLFKEKRDNMCVLCVVSGVI